MRFLPKSSPTTLFCFSPPVMLATLILEFLFAIYVLITAKLRPSKVIIVAGLVCLGIFQLAEYQVCAGDRTLAWMRVGYVAITLLPALGLHLVSLVIKRNWARNLGYILAIAFIGVFLFSTQSISSTVCAGNYILVNTQGVVATTYFPYYYAVSLAIAISEILSFITLKAAYTAQNKEARSLLYWLLGGYAAFLIPTGGIYLLAPTTRAAVPSIMCGFAVFFAIILTFFVFPLCKKLEI